MEQSVFEKARAGRVVTIATVDMETLGLGVNSQVTSIGYGVGVWAPGNTAKPKVVEVAEFTVCRDPLREITQDTIQWHERDPIRHAALKKWYLENGTAPSFGYQLARVAAIFAGYKAEALFIQGKDFDIGLISSASPTMATEFQAASQIPYYHTHCLRDVEALLQGLGNGFKKLKRVKQHTAASDCTDNLHCAFHALDFIYYNR